jgi:DNA-binding transcriptional regulator YdaS (Cro superfamily)
MDALIKRTIETLNRLDCTRGVFARVVGLSESMVSRILSEREPMPPELRPVFEKAVTFLVVMQENSATPVCFHDYRKIEKLWVQFQATYDGMNGDARTAETRAAVQA